MGEVEIWLDPGVNIQKDVEQWFTDGQLLEIMWYTENIYIYIYMYYIYIYHMANLSLTIHMYGIVLAISG